MSARPTPTLQDRREQVQRPKTGIEARIDSPRLHAEHEVFTDLERVQEGYRWSGAAGLVPRVGARVRVRMNGLGLGWVRGYFLSDGGDGGLRFLGLAVELEAPPARYVQQRQRQVRGGRSRGDYTRVFGVEVELL